MKVKTEQERFKDAVDALPDQIECSSRQILNAFAHLSEIAQNLNDEDKGDFLVILALAYRSMGVISNQLNPSQMEMEN